MNDTLYKVTWRIVGEGSSEKWFNATFDTELEARLYLDELKRDDAVGTREPRSTRLQYALEEFTLKACLQADLESK